ncbi:citrate synthase family protein [Deinococcus fonticola]|uniref:citrate synthase family protein n=1 Tax=Deinococcus fonticola TaxID=2528713 RepID=UPI001F0E5710|nr:citrate synthase family protein [Deinococcus fonticola]
MTGQPIALTAAEATRLLGVKPATLYAYVSRGLIRSEVGPAGTREKRYNAQDVQALIGRQSVRRNPENAVQAAVGTALNWGSPILESALTHISEGTLSYRGQEVSLLADTASVEEVAALLWTGDLHGWRELPLRARLNLQAHPRALLPAEAFGYALTHAGTHDVTALDARPDALPRQAARVVNLLYATLERHVSLPGAPDLPFHQRLARAWGVPAQADLLRRALIVLADHELNVSTFAARVTASSGASLHHATLAALCALQGPRHGLASLDAHDLISLARRDGPKSALRDATRRYSRPPGFGHSLYPDGDPRASVLLEALETAVPDAQLVHVTQEIRAAVQAETGERINIDFALAALIHALGRPAGDILTLFALARSVGWLGHAIETVMTGQMIRPRARYVGPATSTRME